VAWLVVIGAKQAMHVGRNRHFRTGAVSPEWLLSGDRNRTLKAVLESPAQRFWSTS
jgi:hypothetical protein